jgi:hypothetical protein
MLYQPQHGDVIDFRALSPRGLPSGRYELELQEGEGGPSFWLHGQGNCKRGAMSQEQLIELEARGNVVPLDPAALGRERQILQLKALAPLRGRHAAHDIDGLALFDHARQPALI